jgi:hypothetical protein
MSNLDEIRILQKRAGITINEGVNDNILYHFTTLNNLIPILRKFILNPSKNGYVSLTRNPKTKWMDYNIHSLVKFTLDKSILKNRYKIEPYADIKNNDNDISYSKNSEYYQSEERIKGDVYIKDALIGITIPSKNDWVKDFGWEFEDEDTTAEEYYDDVLSFLKDNNIKYNVN